MRNLFKRYNYKIFPLVPIHHPYFCFDFDSRTFIVSFPNDLFRHPYSARFTSMYLLFLVRIPMQFHAFIFSDSFNSWGFLYLFQFHSYPFRGSFLLLGSSSLTHYEGVHTVELLYFCRYSLQLCSYQDVSSFERRTVLDDRLIVHLDYFVNVILFY